MARLDKIFRFRENEENPEAVKPFLDHLDDLRWMLVKMAITLVVGMVVAFVFKKPLVDIVERPLRRVAPDVAAHLQIFGVTDPFMIILEVSFYTGIILTFPVLLFYIAQFVLPALTVAERKIVLPAVLVSFGLFTVGVIFSYYCVLPQTLGFFFGFAKAFNWTPQYHVREYYAFVTQMTVAFGAAFELPLVVLLLVYFRVITSAFLRRTRPFAIVIIFCLAAIIAPTPDVVTLISLGGPMCVLYEICIWLGWFVEKGRLRKAAAASRLPLE